VVEGLRGPVGDWERTPKTGDTRERPARRRHDRPRARWRPHLAWEGGRCEAALALYFLGVAGFACRAGHVIAVPFALLLLTGLGAVGFASLRTRGGAGGAAGAG
jgi:hypothetical protein